MRAARACVGAPAKGLALGGAVLVMATVFAGCLGGSPPPGEQTVTINGAGATFPAPLYDKWQGLYTANVKPSVHINYQGVGSGTGITRITNKEVDFGASDAPLSATEFANAAGILHIPTTLGSVVVVYKIPGVTATLDFTPQVLADIFSGNLTQWNDPSLVALNPSLSTVNHNITTVHRSDSSGTTFVFTSYLHKAAPANWTTSGGKGFPAAFGGLGGNGNPGVATLVSSTDYSVGYVELSYVSISTTPLAAGRVRNHDGNFVQADATTTAAAAASLATLPAGDASWTAVEILDQPGANAYPIASMTYILLYKTQTDAAKGKALVDFLWWALHTDGQALCAPNGYAPLPAPVVTHNEATLRMVKDSAGNQLHV